MGERDLYYNDQQYDYDTDKKVATKVENMPYAHLKFFAANHIVVCTRQDRGPTSDSLMISIYTFTLKGELVDRNIFGGQFTRESDWSSFRVQNNIIKVYRYSLNKENYVNKNNTFKVIDKDRPLSVVSIEEYEIDKDGKFKKMKAGSNMDLKFELEFYKGFHVNTDDPIYMKNN